MIVTCRWLAILMSSLLEGQSDELWWNGRRSSFGVLARSSTHWNPWTRCGAPWNSTKNVRFFFQNQFSVRLSIKIDQVEVMIIHYLCEWMRYAVFGPTVGNDWSILRLAVLSNRRRLLLWSSWLETFQFLVTCRGCLKSDLRPLPSSDFDSEKNPLHFSKRSQWSKHSFLAGFLTLYHQFKSSLELFVCNFG